MKLILVWYMISHSYYAGVQYSPPLASREDCQRIAKTVPIPGGGKSYCVQVWVPTNTK